MDEQEGPAEGCSGNSGGTRTEGGHKGFSDMQGVRGMPSLHIDRNNRFVVLDVEEIDSNILSQEVPTKALILELPRKPWME